MDEHYKKHLFKTSEAPFFHASVSNFRAFSVVGENTKKKALFREKTLLECKPYIERTNSWFLFQLDFCNQAVTWYYIVAFNDNHVDS